MKKRESAGLKPQWWRKIKVAEICGSDGRLKWYGLSPSDYRKLGRYVLHLEKMK